MIGKMSRERSMRATCLVTAILALIASGAEGRIIDWQAELERCRALRENITPLLQAGQGISAVGRSGTTARRCAWIEHRAARGKLPGVNAR
jgi:hypothetical protein